MKLNDFFPDKEFEIIDMSDLFHSSGCNSYFINSRCIHAKDQLITIGQSYLLFYESSYNKETKITPVELLHVDLVALKIQLRVKDLLTSQQFQLSHVLDDGSSVCHWLIFDIQYLQKKVKNVQCNDKR